MLRRTHKKTRNGCKRCKIRKVKCDERRPCTNCIRRNEDCSFPTSPLAEHQDRGCDFEPKSQSIDWCCDMYLMHHYGLHASRSILTQVPVHRMFQDDIPEDALRYPYLAQTLLAVSAIHLAYQRPKERRRWAPIAYKHQSAALSSFRTALSNINEKNIHALFAISVLTFMTTVSMSGWGPSVIPDELVGAGDIVEPALLIKGIRNLLDVGSTWIWVQKGYMAPVITPEIFGDCMSHHLPATVTMQFAALRDTFAARLSPSVAQDLWQSLQSLEGIYAEMCGKHNGSAGLVWKWPAMVSEEYMALLKEKHPGALIVYAHFAILSGALKHEWYLRGWPERVVSEITSMVGPSWGESMLWVQEQIADSFPIFDYGGKDLGNDACGFFSVQE